jgi:hypothetical protein
MTERWKPLHAASAKELDILVRSLTDRAEKAEAEVEALRAREQAVRDAIEAELERHTLTNLGDFMFLDQALGRILNALDGDNDA